jgi:8-oxo-dGTP diphosphatase
MIRATLCYVLDKDKVLLIRKKRGIGQGKLNGPGGKIEAGEGIEESAIREVREEVGIEAINPEIFGELDFYFGNEHFMKVYVLRTEKFTGTEIETDEAIPKWFPTEQLPFGEMWADEVFWMPLMFQNKKFSGAFHFDEKGEKLLKHNLTELQP